MVSLLKKKSDAAARPMVPAWHPNFRNYEKLPDVKVVRTAFFVNATALVVLISLASYFGMREWQLHALRVQIAEWRQQIGRDKRPSEAAVALYKKFQTEAAKVDEVDAFVTSRPAVTDILIHIAQTLPENIALNSFDMRESGVVLRFTVRGAPEAAAGYATAYLEQLRADATLTDFDRKKFEFSSQARNTTSGRLDVEFLLRLKPITEKHP